jgi:hypothetical protein
MRFMTRLFAPTVMHSQQEVAERAARVIDHVIFDLGVERLVQGTVALDARLRPHFFSAEPREVREVAACVPLARLAESGAFDPRTVEAGTLREPVAALVEGLLREFRAQSPRFRALPASQ